MCLKGGDGRSRRSIRELASTLLLLLAVRYLAGRGPDEAQGTCSSPAAQLDCIGRVGLGPGTWSRGPTNGLPEHWPSPVSQSKTRDLGSSCVEVGCMCIQVHEVGLRMRLESLLRLLFFSQTSFLFFLARNHPSCAASFPKHLPTVEKQSPLVQA